MNTFFTKAATAALMAVALGSGLVAQGITTLTNGTRADATVVNANFTAVNDKAVAAQTAADAADAKANSAQAAANSAGTSAAAAQTTAVQANTAAMAAQTTANNASTAVNNLTSAITVSKSQVDLDRRIQFPPTLANRRVVLLEGQNNDHQFIGFGAIGSGLRYQIHQTNAAHVFYAGASPTTSDELMRIVGDGRAVVQGGVKVDESDSCPGATGTQASIFSGLAFGAGGTGEGILSGRDSAGPNFKGLDLCTGNQPRVSITNNGNVGVGTTKVTKAKLEVNGTFGSYGGPNPFPYGFYAETAALSGYSTNAGNGFVGASIYASGQVASAGFSCFSDERIKNVVGRSNSFEDLSTLRGIEVTDYRYIDAAKGSRKHKKVIAQQVERVYPQAVNLSTDTVPDIYQEAQVKDCWVELATDLEVGDRVRLIGEQADGMFDVLEVSDGSFRTAFAPSSNKVFVYGREVKDFRTVDYDAIAMLNVSATQELARQLDAKSADMAELQAENADLRAQLESLAAGLAQMKAAMQPLLTK